MMNNALIKAIILLVEVAFGRIIDIYRSMVMHTIGHIGYYVLFVLVVLMVLGTFATFEMNKKDDAFMNYEEEDC